MSEATRRKLAAMLADGKAPKKDRPGLVDDAARLAEAGRYGDKIVAHITPEEAALLKARGGSGTINPRTGLHEFYDSSYDGGGQGNQDNSIGGGGFASDSTGGAAPGAGAMPGEDRATAPNINDFAPSFGQGGVDQTFAMLGEDRVSVPNYGVNMGPNAIAGAQAGGMLGNRLGEKIDNVVSNPVATGINTLASFALGPLGTINSISGFFGGPTLGGALTAAGRAATNYSGADETRDTSPSGDKGGLNDGDSRGGNQSMASGSGGPLAQQPSALAQALMGNTPFNQGRKTFGSLVESFDPNGRRYVSPWAYRG